MDGCLSPETCAMQEGWETDISETRWAPWAFWRSLVVEAEACPARYRKRYSLSVSGARITLT